MIRLLLVLAWTAALAGCGQTELERGTGPATSGAPIVESRAGRAQPRLPTVRLWIATNEITAEVARQPDEIATGMMFRKEMAENEGMLFVFPRPHRTSFYMKNTLIPLSCAYIDPEGVILEVHPMTPLDETPITAASEDVQYVLEMRQGWFERHSVMPGAVVGTEHGTLLETFVRGAF